MELVPGAKEVGGHGSKGRGAGIVVLEDSAGVGTGRPSGEAAISADKPLWGHPVPAPRCVVCPCGV